MKPLLSMGRDEARGLRGLLFDLDDTVLDHGRLTQEAFAALHELADSGLVLIGVTGRPLSWGQVLLRQWPVSGMLAENGNVAVTIENGKPCTLDRLDPQARHERLRRLQGLARRVSAHWPELHETDDTFGRRTDVAFDIAEHFVVEPSVVKAAIAFSESEGARTSVSSIHLHLTFDIDDKATGALRYLAKVHGLDPTEGRHTFAFVGDSENDRAAFAAFETTIGVQNLRGQLTKPPRYITQRARGAGFSEAARHLLELRA